MREYDQNFIDEDEIGRSPRFPPGAACVLAMLGGMVTIAAIVVFTFW